jgi:hypothetical protein
MRRHSTSKFSPVVVFLAAFGVPPPAYAAPESADVAFVEDVSGRVIAFSQGKPTLLGTLDTIIDRTQLDLLPNSELRVCHYQTHQVITLKGPLRASISSDSVAIENGNAVVVFAGLCSAPVTSKFQGGLVVRGIGAVPVNEAAAKR